MGIFINGFSANPSRRSLTGLKVITRKPPVWQTPAGPLGTIMAGTPGSVSVAATALDPLVSYELLGGPLPTGLTFNPATGVIAGTPAGVAQDTTVTFTVRSRTVHGVKADREFSLTVQKATLPADNLFFHYDMAASGTSLLDQSGRGYNATLIGSPTVSNGILALNGTNQYIDFAGNNFNMTHPNYVGSFAFLVKGPFIMGIERTSDVIGFGYVSLPNSGAMAYQTTHITVSPFATTLTANITRNVAEWTFAAISMNNPASTYTFWLGDQKETRTFRNPAQSGPSTYYGYHQTLEIGRVRNYTYGTTYTASSLKHAVHYQRALTDADIARIRAALLA